MEEEKTPIEEESLKDPVLSEEQISAEAAVEEAPSAEAAVEEAPSAEAKGAWQEPQAQEAQQEQAAPEEPSVEKEKAEEFISYEPKEEAEGKPKKQAKPEKENFFARWLKKAFAKKFWFYIPFNVMAIVMGLVGGFTTLFNPIITVDVEEIAVKSVKVISASANGLGSVASSEEERSLYRAEAFENTKEDIAIEARNTALEKALVEVLKRIELPKIQVSTMDFVHFASVESEKLLDELAKWALGDFSLDLSDEKKEEIQQVVVESVTSVAVSTWVSGSVKEDASEEEVQQLQQALTEVSFAEAAKEVSNIKFEKPPENASEQQKEQIKEKNKEQVRPIIEEMIEEMKKIPTEAIDMKELIGTEIKIGTVVENGQERQETLGELVEKGGNKEMVVDKFYEVLDGMTDDQGNLPTEKITEIIESIGEALGSGMDGLKDLLPSITGGGMSDLPAVSENGVQVPARQKAMSAQAYGMAEDIQGFVQDVQEKSLTILHYVFLVAAVFFVIISGLWFLMALMAFIKLFKTRNKKLKFWYVKTFGLIPAIPWVILTIFKSEMLGKFLVDTFKIEALGDIGSGLSFLDSGMGALAICWLICMVLSFVILPFNSKLKEEERD